MGAYRDTQSTDGALVERIKLGDERAIQTLFDQNQGRLFGYICRVLGNNKSDADDLLEETFIRAIFNIDRYVGGSSVSTWMFSIAHNVTCDYVRQRKARERRAPMVSLERFACKDSGETRVPARQKTPDALIVDEEVSDRVQRALYEALDDLSGGPHIEKQRDLLVGHYFRGQTYDEICRKTGLSYEAVKCLMFRGRRSLAQKLLIKGVTPELVAEYFAGAA